jgi:hypothetical protein
MLHGELEGNRRGRERAAGYYMFIEGEGGYSRERRRAAKGLLHREERADCRGGGGRSGRSCCPSILLPRSHSLSHYPSNSLSTHY